MLLSYFLDCKRHDSAFMLTLPTLSSPLSFDSPLGKRFVTRPVTQKKKKKKKNVLFILRVHELNPVISTHQGQIWRQSIRVGINAANKRHTSAVLSRCISLAALSARQKHLIALVSRLVSPQTWFALRGSRKEEEHCVECRWVCFDYELIGNVGLVSDLFWESDQRSTLCRAFALTQCSSVIKKASILHCKPLILCVCIYIYIWLYSIKWSGCMFNNFLKNFFSANHRQGR